MQLRIYNSRYTLTYLETVKRERSHKSPTKWKMGRINQLDRELKELLGCTEEMRTLCTYIQAGNSKGYVKKLEKKQNQSSSYADCRESQDKGGFQIRRFWAVLYGQSFRFIEYFMLSLSVGANDTFLYRIRNTTDKFFDFFQFFLNYLKRERKPTSPLI